MKTVLVTGVSTGIGRGIATVLGRAGWHVYGSVRKTEDAAAFEAALAGQGTALLFDVTDDAAIAAAAQELSTKLGDVGLDGLVNNAGIAIGGPMEYAPLPELRRQFDVNVFGLVAVTQAFLPLLGAKGKPRKRPGRIINISSVGGRFTFPFFGPYSASKHAVEAISDAMRRELLVHGIDVIVIEPGAIKTPIWEKGRDQDAAPYEGTPYYDALQRALEATKEFEAGGLDPEDVGALALKILTRSRPKTRYVIQRGGSLSFRIRRALPDRFIDRVAAQQLGIKRRK